jgi:hypothetical protein
MLAMAGYYSGRVSLGHQSAMRVRETIEFAFAYWEGFGGEVTVQ